MVAPNTETAGRQCTALNISDEKPCEEIATSINGLFCTFHSRQCQGLYRGYKRRNAELDTLSQSPPKYLVESKTPLINELFSDVKTEEVCKEIHDYLFKKLQLLERVIRARKLHHSRFFASSNDYGHVNYLNKLHNQRGSVTQALEHIERRTAEILYHNQKWFKWIRECQNEEAATREKEQKKVKMEAALFRRQWKEVQQRLEELRIKEWHKKQDAALEQAYKDSLSGEGDDGSDWDPIDDVVEDERENFIDLIKRFLWMSIENKDVDNQNNASNNDVELASKDMADLDISSGAHETENATSTKSNGTKSKKSKSKKKKSQNSKSSNTKPEEQKPNQDSEPSPIETKEQMYDRLRNGRDYNEGIKLGELPVWGVMVGGTMENPEIDTKTARYPEEKVQKLLAEITEIKHLLFCRLLLGHATLLPAALRAESVEAFLAASEVTEAALRDLCLKMENPGPQEIRDACADLFRENEVEYSDFEAKPEASKESSEEDPDVIYPRQPKDALPKKWVSAREKEREKAGADKQDDSANNLFNVGASGGFLDFGEVKEEYRRTRKMIRVKICGRWIWNYPSSKSMSRRGWLHFCIIAKDSSLNEAIPLCRSWEEFYELNILAIWDYFPSIRWGTWCSQKHDEQLKTLGFIPYAENQPDANELMRTSRVRFSRVRGAKFESRNWMCAYMKRDDPASRRFLQYLAMNSECFLLVRDAETGQILVKPPEEERWTMRASAPQGHHPGKKIQGEWDILEEIGPQFFEQMDKFREWNFSFKDHYDVYIWNVQVGEPYAVLYNAILHSLIKAHRARNVLDIFGQASHIMKSLTWAEENKRIRDAEPGEQSVWDYYTSGKMKFFIGKSDVERNLLGPEPKTRSIQTPKSLFYNEADVLEDEVLFPEEKESSPPAAGKISTSRMWEDEGTSFKQFLDHMVDSNSDFDSSDGSDEDSEWDTDDSDEVPGMGADLKKMLDKKDVTSLRELMRREPSAELMETFTMKRLATVFHEAWHDADLEPDARKHYIESLRMGKAARRYAARLGITGPQSVLGFSVCQWLDPNTNLDHSPEDQKEIMKAVEKLSPFFLPSFKKSKEGREFKDSMLLNQEERAKQFSVWRCSRSNTEQPKKFWSEWDRICKPGMGLDDLPVEWDKTIRPIIAKLWKAGVIRTKRDNDYVSQGQAVAVQDPSSGRMEMFVDYRDLIKTISLSAMQVDPETVPPLLPTAKIFAKNNPKARFALLRIWTAPHFYPLMLGPESRPPLSFQDCTGRDFIWMFIPKDMPYSDYSMHMNASTRLKQFPSLPFRNQVVVKRDTYLCMGKDEKELMKIATAVTWLVQRRPWRLEIDLWKSFLNVDLGFLEKLPEQYWPGKGE